MEKWKFAEDLGRVGDFSPPKNFNGRNRSLVKHDIAGPAIYIVASPIGNLGDLSPRAIEILKAVSRIACEDTRHSLKLFSHFGIQKPLISLHEHNEFQKSNEILQTLKETGETLAYLSDAGTPGISDPGCLLVEAAHRMQVPVFTVPGPSAFAAALSCSGFHLGPVRFDGFFPRKASEKKDLVDSWGTQAPCRVVFFESPNRIRKTVEFLTQNLPLETEICFCRELTKKHEQNLRTTLGEIGNNPDRIPERGEYAVVIQLMKASQSHSQTTDDVSIETLAQRARSSQIRGQNLKMICKDLARQYPSFSAKTIYQAALLLELNPESHLELPNHNPLQKTVDFQMREMSSYIIGLDAPPHALNCVSKILNEWFQKGFGRKQPLKISSKSPFSMLEIWCARIFKRGLLRCTIDEQALEGSSMTPLIPVFSELTPELMLEKMSAAASKGDVLCLVDSGFAEHWHEWRDENVASGLLFYSPSEATKTLDTLREFAQHIGPNTRSIWTIGGGILSDIGGFLAGLYELEHHSCPTTLLAASDASIGGKTGVNYPPYGKNQIGLFYGTQSWIIVPEYFETLDDVQILCGLAETAKHLHLVGNHDSISSVISRSLKQDKKLSKADITAIIRLNFRIKSAIVLSDPHEVGVRATLNFGHTIAHILEGLAQDKCIEDIPHGIAVAAGIIGLIRANEIKTDQDLEEILLLILKKAHVSLPIPVHHGKEDVIARIKALASSDKKMEYSDSVNLTLPPFGVFASILRDEGPLPNHADTFKRSVSHDEFVHIISHVIDI